MGEHTAIAWTDHTFNPWWGCQRVSPGCEHCYAETFAKRTGHDVWGPEQTTPHRFFAEKHWQDIRTWEAAAERRGQPVRVFCASMADVFEDRRDLDRWRAKLWHEIEATPHLTWQLLTKRPREMQTLVPEHWQQEGWPVNVWAGTTVEGPGWEWRIAELHWVPAAVKFLSLEPLLGLPDLSLLQAELVDVADGKDTPVWLPPGSMESQTLGVLRESRISWLIAGGESGPGGRYLVEPCGYRKQLDYCVPEIGKAACVICGAAHVWPTNQAVGWMRAIRDRCIVTNTSYFLKQWGGLRPGGEAVLDGLIWHQFPDVSPQDGIIQVPGAAYSGGYHG